MRIATIIALPMALVCHVAVVAQASPPNAPPAQVEQPVGRSITAADLYTVDELYYNPSTLTPRDRVLMSSLVVSGKIKDEKKVVELKSYAQAKDVLKYKRFTLNVDKVLHGAKVESLTLLVPASDPTFILPNSKPGSSEYPAIRPQIDSIQVIDGQEGVFFLSHHPISTKHYALTLHCIPLNPLDTPYKEHLAIVERTANTIKDPLKALRDDKPENRYEAMQTIVAYLRTYPANAPKGYAEVPIDAELNAAILKTLLEFDFAAYDQNKPMKVEEYKRHQQNNPIPLLRELELIPGKHGYPDTPILVNSFYGSTKEQLKKFLESDAGKKYRIKTWKAK